MRRGLLALSILVLPGLAAAQPVSGPYVGLGAGPGFLLDQVQRPSPGAPAVKQEFAPGAAETGSLGYGFGNGLRLEVQGIHQANPARGSIAPSC